MAYLSGGEQTTINSTITELFPAIAFNTGKSFSSPEALEEYIMGLDLENGDARKSFVNHSNVDAAYGYLSRLEELRPSIKKTKLENAIGILNWINDYNNKRNVEKVVWGYREKPSGVPNNHAGDIFLIHKDKNIKPKVLGVSLKAGTATSKEPKLNSYVGTTLRKPAWKKAYPNAITKLKNDLWTQIYSKIPDMPKSMNKSNWLQISTTRQTPHKCVQQAVLDLFKENPSKFDEYYVKMNTISRNQLVCMINGNLNATKQWINEEFRLQKQDVDVPMILVKAIGTNAVASPTDPLRDILPSVTKVNAYLKSGSVQEWFIDLMTEKSSEKMTLSMTIRSDSEYREAKQKGKLGAYTMLKLLYRG